MKQLLLLLALLGVGSGIGTGLIYALRGIAEGDIDEEDERLLRVAAWLASIGFALLGVAGLVG